MRERATLIRSKEIAMSDVDVSPEGVDPEAQSGALATAADAIVDILSSATLPAPIRRNALKAFGRLCAAAVEIPVAYLEGVAEEKRAESKARTRLITATADQIANQLQVDPAYARAAVKKFGERVLRDQVNLEKVAEVAAIDLGESPPRGEQAESSNSEQPGMNDDWLNTFEKEASQKSTAEMQLLFGRILAGEIRQPSRFSIKTLKLAGELDGAAAKLFLRLCSTSISLRIRSNILDARVLALGGNAGSNSLGPFGLSFDQLNVLQEYGLIIPDYNSYFDYKFAVTNAEGKATLGIEFQRQTWVLVPTTARSTDEPLRLHGVRLSKSGTELLPILDLEQQEVYSTALVEFFSTQGLQFTKVPTR